MCIAPVGQGFAGDILHRQVRQSVRTHPGVVQPCNVGVLQRRQDVTLPGKTARKVLAQAQQHRELQGHVTLEGSVGALRQPYLGHAAFAEQPDDPVGAHDFTRPWTASDPVEVAPRAGVERPGQAAFPNRHQRLAQCSGQGPPWPRNE